MSALCHKRTTDRRDAFEKNQARHNEKSRTSSRLPVGLRLRQAFFWASLGPQQMSTLEAVIVKLFPLLMFLGLISPLVALLSAVLFYNRHRDRVEPERRVGGISYVLAVIVCGVIFRLLFGVIFGMQLACSSPSSSKSLRFVGLLRYWAAPNGSGNFPYRLVALFFGAACVEALTTKSMICLCNRSCPLWVISGHVQCN